MRKLATLLWSSFFIWLVLVLAGPAVALPVTFTKVADTSTAIPGGSGSFTSFGREAAIDGGHVTFRGEGDPPLPFDPFQQGIYSNAGGLQVVADQGTAIPSGAGNFETFAPKPSPDGASVAWNGDGAASQEGIYRDDGGGAVRVADRTMLLPGGQVGELFDSFVFSPVLDGGDIAFHAVGDGGVGTPTEGIYSDLGGSLAAIVDSNTTIPTTAETFSFLSTPDLDGGTIAFRGQGGSGFQGVYTSTGGPLTTVADTNTGVPSSPETFVSFGGTPVVSGTTVVFLGTDTSGLTGLYEAAIGISVIADENTLIPDGGGNTFQIFGSYALDGGATVFKGVGAPGQIGLYTNFGGALEKIIDTGDTLDGKNIIDLEISEEAISGSQIVFWARFTDGSEGVFVATVPEPGTGALLLLGLAGLAGQRRTT